MDVTSPSLTGLAPRLSEGPSTDSGSPVDKVSREFEKMFVAGMLRLTELGGSLDGAFSGGFGEEAFRSFMIDAYAEQIAATGQMGIAEMVVQSLNRKDAP
jgi:Rod binding domain-containing protein